ncbi:MAG: hypothetical protein GX456_00765, partial [Verrucomicrobia bacterium]|nr:hypothetical protein [Verrucomicrobiota bacterium]
RDEIDALDLDVRAWIVPRADEESKDRQGRGLLPFPRHDWRIAVLRRAEIAGDQVLAIYDRDLLLLAIGVADHVGAYRRVIGLLPFGGVEEMELATACRLSQSASARNRRFSLASWATTIRARQEMR